MSTLLQYLRYRTISSCGAMQARLRAAIAHAAIARAAIARATIARAQPTYSIVWRQNTGGLRAARVLSSVVRRRWQADNRCDGDGRWAMDNMRGAWIVVAIIGACVRCVFFFFLLCTIPLRTHCTYLSTIYSHIMSHALFLILCTFRSSIDDVFWGSRSCVMGGPGGTWEEARNM